MSFDQCKTCRKWGWTDRHQCPPLWLVAFDGDDQWFQVYAADAERAASEGAEQVDCENEYWIVRNGSAQALVKRNEDDEPEAFFVEAETRPHYSAARVRT